MPENDRPEFDRPTLFLLDGHALIYRAFYAMISRPLTTSSGENTSAPYGLAQFLVRLMEEERPDYLAVVFDAGDSFRTELLEEYKATRTKMPDELEASIPRCRDILEGFRVPCIEVEGWEADDVIGTLAEQAEEAGLQTVIVSGDKDFYQLIGPRTALLNPGRGGPAGVDQEWVTPENARERLGVAPERVTDYLALIGDSSDNVPGVRGIGKKTAPTLIERFGSLEEILARSEDVSSTRARNALREHGEAARLSKRLVTIRRDAPVTLDPERLRREPPDRRRLRDIFLELEFHQLLRDYAPETPAEALREAYETVRDAARAREVADSLAGAERMALRVLAEGSDPLRARIVGLGLAAEPGHAFYLPLGHRPPEVTRDAEGNPALALEDAGDAPRNLTPLADEAMAPVRALLASDLPKVGHDLKREFHLLRRAGAPLAALAFDTELASYCLDPSKREHSLELLAMDRRGHRLATRERVAGTGRAEVPLAEVPPEEAACVAQEAADFALRLAEELEEDLRRHRMQELFERIEMPLIPVLAAMERVGIAIDRDFFARLLARLERELGLVMEEICKIAGEEVNLRSVPQMRELLFDRLELPVVKRTKTGPSTDESVLAELAAQGHEVPRLVLEYRELDKLCSTYVRVLPQLVNETSGRIHTSFNQAVAATGRLSSSDPNLQNIPIRSALGREIRKGFVPAEGYVFLGADYSQVELRVMAHLSGDPAFVEAFRGGRDVHRETAARIFGVEPERVTPQMRERAKTINFATIYGQGPVALAAQLGISRREARAFIDAYFERFSGVTDYIERMKAQAREKGYVETLLGRRRYIPEIRSRNPGVRGFGERTAANSPIQGTAADLIKLAMIRLHARLEALAEDGAADGSSTTTARTGAGSAGGAESGLGDGRPARMLLTVHDELLFEVRRGREEEVAALVREEMEGAIELDVPLEVDIGVGESWYDCKG